MSPELKTPNSRMSCLRGVACAHQLVREMLEHFDFNRQVMLPTRCGLCAPARKQENGRAPAFRNVPGGGSRAVRNWRKTTVSELDNIWKAKVCVFRSSVQHGFWALKIEAMSKPEYRTMLKSVRSNPDLPR